MSRARLHPLVGVGGLLVVLGVLVMTLRTPLNIVSPEAYDLRGNTGHDFRLAYSAAHLLALHRNPYDAGVFLRQALEDGVPSIYLLYHGTLSQPYVYPPIFAWFLIPLTLLEPARALFVWRVLSVLLVFLGSLGLARAYALVMRTALIQSSFTQVLLAATIAVAPLTLYAVYWGNPVVIVYAAMGGWIYALCRKQVWWDGVAGVLMSVSLLKPQLALPLAVIAVATLVRGEGRSSRLRAITLGFCASVVCLLILDVLVTPAPLLIAWPRAIAQLSGMIALQPDMPSLFGLVRFLVPAVAGYNAVYIGIVVVGGIMTVALYFRLRNVWQPTVLLDMLTIVWCFATPYSHGNDQLLLVPGGLALITRYAGSISPINRDMMVLKRLPGRFKHVWLTCIVAVALAALWAGSLPILLHYHSHSIPGVAVTVAPLLLLVAFVATSGSRSLLTGPTQPHASIVPAGAKEAPGESVVAVRAEQIKTQDTESAR